MYKKYVITYAVIPEVGHVKEHMACFLNLGYNNILYHLCPHPPVQNDVADMGIWKRKT